MSRDSLKDKAEQLEQDLLRSQQSAIQLIERNKQLVTEIECQKQHGGHVSMQIDNLKRELQDTLVSDWSTSCDWLLFD